MALPVLPAVLNAGAGDANTNPVMRTFQQTQGTSDAQDQVAQLIAGPGITEVAAPITSAGVGVTDDTATPPAAATVAAQDDGYGGGSQAELDAITQAQNTTTATLNTNNPRRIIPQANVLDKFSSYTYRASWYILNPEQYKQLVLSHKRSVNGYQLLVQSGGAPVNSGGFRGASAQGTGTQLPAATDADAGRNPAFPQDFYIDSITIDNLFTGAGTRLAHAVKDIKFTVVEPNGITFLDRLYEAVQDYVGASAQTQGVNYNAVVYLLVIRFYGYDEQGNLVTNIGAPGPQGKTDPNAVIEKFIPFRITKCDWTVESRLVTYNIEAKAHNVALAAGTRRGTIPYDIQLAAKTVGQLLGGDVTYSTTPATAAAPGTATTPSAGQPQPEQLSGPDSGYTPPPPTAATAPTPGGQLTQGLMGAMNEFQQNLVKEGVYEYPDTYNIIFANPGPGGGGSAIETAQIVPPGQKKPKRSTATEEPPTNSPQSAEGARQANDTLTKVTAITAGMQIVQAIELVIRNSTFITDQELTFFNIDDAQTQKDRKTKEVTWFNITFQAVQKQYDKKRNDFAYDITFIINTYTPFNFSSVYFPINNFQGLHKSYPYWFTGKNSAVLDYKETLNNLYNLTISGKADQKNLRDRQTLTSSMRDQPFFNYQSASTESRQGVEGKANEPASNLAECLYDPAGLANCKLKIVGDPAWIQQGSFAGGVNAREFDFNAFLPDGTINFDAQQIMFEVAWQRPEDYDILTGIADPYAKTADRQPRQSRVYTAKSCTSEFRQGTFTQTIEGLLFFFPRPDGQNRAPGAPAPDTGLLGIEVRDESGALSPYRKNPETGELYTPLPGTRAQALTGDGLTVASSAFLPNPNSTINTSAIDAAAAADGARGQNSLVPVNPVNTSSAAGAPPTFSAAPPGAPDTVAPANPPKPPTDGVGGQPVAAPPLPTPAFVSTGLNLLGGLVQGTTLSAQFNADLARYAPGAASTRVTAAGLASEPVTPQIISQDY